MSLVLIESFFSVIHTLKVLICSLQIVYAFITEEKAWNVHQLLHTIAYIKNLHKKYSAKILFGEHTNIIQPLSIDI